MIRIQRCLRIVFVAGLWLAMMTPAWAQSVTVIRGGGGSSYKTGIGWGVVLLFLFLGMIVALKSSGRKLELKHRGPKFDRE